MAKKLFMDGQRTPIEANQREALYGAILEAAPQVIWQTDAEGACHYINQAWEDVTGMTKEEAFGSGWATALHPDDAKAMAAKWERAYTRGESYSGICRFQSKDGSYRTFDFLGTPVRDTSGKVICWVGINTDITERKQIEEALEEREKHFRLFSMSTGDCFWNWDMVLGTVDRSSGFERTFGYTQEEIPPDIEWSRERIHPEDKERIWKVFDTALAGTQTRCAYEYRFRCEDGSYAVIDDHVCLIRDASGKVVRSLGAMRDITRRRRAEQQILENQAQLKSLASALVQAEERERNRIAVHLHDGVCQSLAYAKMKLQMVNAALDDPTQRDAMEEISDTLTQIMQEVRTLTFELSSPVLREFGLEAAIAQWLKEQIEQKHGIATEFTDGGQAQPLAEDIRALLFRCVRELLANVVKHSQAKRVRVSISRAEHQIVICLEDDGVGFVPDEVEVGKDAGGFGLFSIREQLSQLSGSLKIDSGPSQGCRSILRAPLLPSSVNGRRTP